MTQCTPPFCTAPSQAAPMRCLNSSFIVLWQGMCPSPFLLATAVPPDVPVEDVAWAGDKEALHPSCFAWPTAPSMSASRFLVSTSMTASAALRLRTLSAAVVKLLGLARSIIQRPASAGGRAEMSLAAAWDKISRWRCSPRMACHLLDFPLFLAPLSVRRLRFAGEGSSGAGWSAGCCSRSCSRMVQA